MSASFAPECSSLKGEYDKCFNQWYSEKFLKGKSVENGCAEEWYEYMQCVDKNLIKRGIKPLLEEARKEAPFKEGGKPAEK